MLDRGTFRRTIQARRGFQKLEKQKRTLTDRQREARSQGIGFASRRDKKERKRLNVVHGRSGPLEMNELFQERVFTATVWIEECSANL